MTDKAAEIVTIDYTNHRGVRGLRRIIPQSISFTQNQWHSGGPRWILSAYALDRRGVRAFAMENIHSWREGE